MSVRIFKVDFVQGNSFYSRAIASSVDKFVSFKINGEPHWSKLAVTSDLFSGGEEEESCSVAMHE